MPRTNPDIATVSPVDPVSAMLMGWRRWKVALSAADYYGPSYYRSGDATYSRFLASSEDELREVLRSNIGNIRLFLNSRRDSSGRRQHPAMIKTGKVRVVVRGVDTTSVSIAPSLHFTPRGPMMLMCRNGMVYDENYDFATTPMAATKNVAV
jgi:hypothetical protein